MLSLTMFLCLICVIYLLCKPVAFHWNKAENYQQDDDFEVVARLDTEDDLTASKV
jgi:hypothetical protein